MKIDGYKNKHYKEYKDKIIGSININKNEKMSTWDNENRWLQIINR